MKLFYPLLLIFFLWTSSIAKAQVSVAPGQPVGRQNPHHYIHATIVVPHTLYTIPLPVKATSLALQINTLQSFANAYIMSGRDTFRLVSDVHAQEQNPGGINISNLLIFPEPISQVHFYSGNVSGEAAFHLLNAGELRVDPKPYRNSQIQEDCSRPATIGQNVWRAGLPAPAQLPEANQVAHLIVHHSATSNTVTDYTSAVRNIYLYHTQVNGWNDIGYNFLIAPDGTIFEGRDGRERIEDDSVLGAHFCGKNRGTMGICLLGTFTAVAPTQKAQEALVKIASWKADKENLMVLNSALHPPGNTNASLLNIMAGHRDGCSTECPGSLTYSLLPQLRTQVQRQVEACREPVAQQITLYPQPAGREVFVKATQGKEIQSFTLYDITGKLKQIQAAKPANGQIRLDTRTLAAGMYILYIQLSDSTSFTRKMLIL
jgi:hypothetical protein